MTAGGGGAWCSSSPASSKQQEAGSSSGMQSETVVRNLQRARGAVTAASGMLCRLPVNASKQHCKDRPGTACVRHCAASHAYASAADRKLYIPSHAAAAAAAGQRAGTHLASQGTPVAGCLCVALPASAWPLAGELLDGWPAGTLDGCLRVVQKRTFGLSVAAGRWVGGFAGACSPVVKALTRAWAVAASWQADKVDFLALVGGLAAGAAGCMRVLRAVAWERRVDSRFVKGVAKRGQYLASKGVAWKVAEPIVRLLIRHCMLDAARASKRGGPPANPPATCDKQKAAAAATGSMLCKTRHAYWCGVYSPWLRTAGKGPSAPCMS